MKRKDSLAILGLLFSGPFEVYYAGNDPHNMVEHLYERLEYVHNILDYLQSLKLPYTFVRDILTDDYGSKFYHIQLGKNSIPLPSNYKKESLYDSEHDGQIWFDDNGRLGVWCEVDGFVAWLDEYKTVWVVDSREEVKKQKAEFKKFMKKSAANFRKCFVKAIKTLSENPPNFPDDQKTVEIAKLEIPGIDFIPIKKQ